MSIAFAKRAKISSVVLSVAVVSGCGAATSSSTSSDAGQPGQVVGGSSAGGAIGTSGATAVGATNGGGTTSVGGAGSSGSTSTVVAGQQCSPLGVLGCSTDATQILFCRSDSKWAVKEPCATGLVCNPSSIATEGVCVTPPSPDPICGGKTSAFCDNGYLYECDADGIVTYRSICPSRACSGSGCAGWDACAAYAADKGTASPAFDLWCIGGCGSAIGTWCGVDSSGGFEGASVVGSYFTRSTSSVGVEWDAGIPGSASWPTVAACPDVSATVISAQSNIPVQIEVPEPYWLVTTTTSPSSAAGYAAAVSMACTGQPLRLPATVTFGLSAPDQWVIIATRDPNAPAFWLHMVGLAN